MSYKDDGVTLDYDRLKTYSYSSEDKATTQDTSIHTSPHSLSKGSISHSTHTPFAKGLDASRENNSVSQTKQGGSKPIVVLDEEPIFYSLEREKSGDNIEAKPKVRKAKIMVAEGGLQRREEKTKNPEIAVRKQGKKMREETLKRNQSVYTVIDDDLTIFENMPLKKVKSEVRPELDERIKDNSSKRKKKKKEEIKGNGILKEESQTITKPNYLSNRIPDFFSKFQTENMYIINRAFYFDPVKVAL
jgi:hypothetical protein